MSSANREDNVNPAIATKAELLQRLRERTKPSAQAHLSPSGINAQSVRKNSDEEIDRRIALLRTSLSSAHDTVEVQHSFARLNGFAVAQFAKER